MNKKYSKYDIEKSLSLLNITKGDTVFVTTSLGMLGMPEGITSTEELNALFYQTILETLGEEGTLVVPTYSYTFGKHRITQPAIFSSDTPAEIGPFPNYVLKQPGVLRSQDPFMSVATIGSRAQSLIDNLPLTSYGKDSIFERLIYSRAKCLTIGLGPNWTPFIHYLDWIAQVPFRYDKLFAGYFSNSNKKIIWNYSVPVLCVKAISNAHEVGISAEKEGIWRYSELGRARVYACDYKEYFDYCKSKIEKDPWLFVKEKNWDAIKEERKRVNYQTKELKLIDLIDLYKGIELPPLGEEIDSLINALEKEYEFKSKQYKTGQEINGNIIPEGWKCVECKVHTEKGHTIINDIYHALPYSLSFEGHVSGKELAKHFNLESEYPPFIERDWRLNHIENIEEIEIYKVEVKCLSYYTTIKTLKNSDYTEEKINLSKSKDREKLLSLLSERKSISIASHDMLFERE